MTKCPCGILETSIGKVSFTMTEASHVFLRTEEKEGQRIIIRGIPYHVSFHCHLIDGSWQRTKDYHDLYLSRRDCYKEASQAARKTAAELLAACWSGYLVGCPELSRQAEQAKVAYEMERLEEELAALKQKVQAKQTELESAQKRLATI